MSKKSVEIKAPRAYPKKRETERRRPSTAMLAAAVLGIVALAAAFAFVGRGGGAATPTGGVVGQPAPSFSEQDVQGNTISSDALRGKNVLLFFSEGVMCQACFEQIKGLERNAAELKKRNLVLVMITNDQASLARQAAEVYRIATPLIADEDRSTTGAYDVGGQGMHPDTAGHTFVLVDAKGVIRWRRDYWTGANPTMYVPPAELFAAIPKV